MRSALRLKQIPCLLLSPLAYDEKLRMKTTNQAIYLHHDAHNYTLFFLDLVIYNFSLSSSFFFIALLTALTGRDFKWNGVRG